jgi:hypothetical protein
MSYTLPSNAIPSYSLPTYAIPYLFSAAPPAPPPPPATTSTISVLYVDVENYTNLAYNSLLSYTYGIDDAIAYAATIQTIPAKLDIYNSVLASRNSTDFQTKLATLVGYARLMNNIVLQRYNYTDINDFLDEYEISVSEKWAEFSANAGVIIDPAYID